MIMHKVIINGVEKEYPRGTVFLDIAKEYQNEYENDILLVSLNNHLRELNKTLKYDGELSFITANQEIGIKTYRRSALFLLVKAIFDVSGKEMADRFFVQFSLSKGLYCTFKGMDSVSQDYLDQLEVRMRELRDQALPINKISYNTDEAIQRFARHGMDDKVKLFKYRRSSRVNMYKVEKLEDYYYGYMVPDTSYVKYFELYPYDEGFVIQLPTKKAPKEVPAFEPQNKLFQVQKDSSKWGEMLGLNTVGDLNDMVTRGKLNEVIMVQEALQEKKIGQIAQMISERGNVKFVMVAGPSSSGKTTFSHRLSIQLIAHGMRPHPIAVDNYFVDREKTPKDENGEYDFECLGAIDTEGFNNDMTRLLAGETVDIPEFNFKTGKREYKGNYLTLGDDDILVIEGIHCLNDALSYNLPKENKFKIYISALTTLNVDEHNRIPTTDGRLIRRMVRDARTRGTSAKRTLEMWPSVRRGEEKNIFPYQEEADVMFNSALIYELAVLKQYAEPALFGIDKNDPVYLEAKRLLKFLDYFIGIPADEVPKTSLLREFLGGGGFKL